MRYLKTSIISLTFLLAYITAAAADVWESVPLRTQAQVASNNPGGEGMQVTFDIAYSPTNSPDILGQPPQKTVYLVTDIAQAWKSTDSGNSWSAMSVQLGIGGGISIMPVKESDILSGGNSSKDILFVAGSTHGYSQEESSLNGIYVSSNEGGSWSKAIHAEFFRGIRGGENFAVDAIEHTIYAGTGTGDILFSTNGGIEWNVWKSEANYSIMDLKILPNRIMLVTGRKMTVGTPRLFQNYASGRPMTAMFKVSLDDANPILTEVMPEGKSDDTFNPIVVQKNPCDGYSSNSVYSVYVALGVDGVGKLNFSNSSTTLSGVHLPVGATDGSVEVLAVSTNACNENNQPAQMHIPYNISYDGGQNWATSHDDPNFPLRAIGRRGSMGVIAIDPLAPANTSLPNTVLSSGDAVVRSEDGGQTWQYSNTGHTGGLSGGHGNSSLNRTNKATNTFVFQDENNFAMFLTDHGMMVHTDHNTPTNKTDDSFSSPLAQLLASCPFLSRIKFSNPYPVRDALRDAVCKGWTTETGDVSGKAIVTATGLLGNNPQTLIYSLDGGENWTAPMLDGEVLKDKFKFIKFVSPTVFYANNYRGEINYSNAKVEIEELSRPVVAIDASGVLYSAYTPEGGGPLQLYFSENSGSSWTQFLPGSPAYPTLEKFESMVVSKSGNKIYLTSKKNGSGNFGVNGAWKCTVTVNAGDKSCSWVLVEMPAGEGGHALLISPANEDEICVGRIGGGVYCGGYPTLTQVGLENQVLSFVGPDALSVNPFNGDLYAGSSHGTWVYRNYFGVNTDNDQQDNKDDDDDDNDGVDDNIPDNCPFNANSDQVNSDNDRQGDACDIDDDDDGLPDSVDAYPLDTDNDGLVNNSDNDDDNDGVLDTSDNCPFFSNADQENVDNDTEGDVCDSDDDDDGIPDASDEYPLNDDNQDDGDSVSFNTDNCPFFANPNQLDTDNDGQGNICDVDDDNDEMRDAVDNCALIVNPGQIDSDHDGYGNACDGDLNNDEKLDVGDLRELISAGFGTWVYISTGKLMLAPVPHINKELSELDQQVWHQWAKDPGYEPGPSGLSCAGTIPCPAQ